MPYRGNPDPEVATHAAFAAESLTPHSWSNAAATHYDWHTHPYDKVLFCIRGGITFHTDNGDCILVPGDRLDIPMGTPHAATVGAAGVTCLEAAHRA